MSASAKSARSQSAAFEGVPHRLYFEEAGPKDGSGIPLVCLHTAGADNRQYRHLLADPEVTSRFRVLAFDMPWHGKSTPPDGWHTVGVAGPRQDCLDHIERVWTDMRPLSLRRAMAEDAAV